jgi:hypothetical protein
MAKSRKNPVKKRKIPTRSVAPYPFKRRLQVARLPTLREQSLVEPVKRKVQKNPAKPRFFERARPNQL